MKISYVCPTNCVRRPISELAMQLTDKGHSITVAYPFSNSCPTEGWGPNKRLALDLRVKKLEISAWYISSLRYNVPKPFALLFALREIFRADVVHLWEYWYPLSVAVMFYAFFTGQRHKLIMTTDGLVGYSYKPRSPWWLVPAFKVYTQTIGKVLFWLPKRLTTYGKAMISFAALAGLPFKKFEVIPTGIHLPAFQDVAASDVLALRKEFGIVDGEQVLLFVGMLSSRKGIDIVIDVGQRLLESGWAGKVLIVGDAHGKENYPSMVKTQWLDSIIFTGGRSDVPSLMNLADCLLLPSEGEGLPGVVMEAMAASCSAVATNEGCTPDLIDSGENGFLVSYKDVDGYEKAVRKVLSDSANFGKKAFEKIRQFSWEEVCEKYLAFYQEMGQAK